MMISVKRILITLTMAGFIVSNAKGDTFGPLTFGSSAPILEGEFYPQYDVVQLSVPSVSFDAIGSTAFDEQTYAFTFDIAPGWTIEGISLYGSLDDGDNQLPSQTWGDEYEQQMTLCPVIGACSTASEFLSNGRYPLPQFSLNATAGPGTGVYQYFYYAVNNAGIPNPPGPFDANIYLTQVSPVPEPPSWLLWATGLAATAGIFFWRNRQTMPCLPVSKE
ncbi:MAG TPA: hypothetical protein VFU68_03185 [Terracidiphilus sp.]|nr:hypothetical protein [Terracidiphilus sp.]